MNKQLVLAIDLGTTTCKTILLDEQLNIIARAVREYPFAVPKPSWAEQSPEQWWSAVSESIRQIVSGIKGKSVKAVGLSGQMHGLVILNESGKVLRPAILWNDQRSAPQCQEIYDCVGGQKNLLAFTNNPVLPGYIGGKILWVRKHEPEIFEQIATILPPKDYLRYRLTGSVATDVSDASGTGLYDVRNRRWSRDLLSGLALPMEWFPKVYNSLDLVGTIDPAVAAETGLDPSTPVIAGGGDAVMQAVGEGTIGEADALIVIGTGGNVTVSTDRPINNPEGILQVFCHVLPKRWVAMGVTLSAGNSLKWFRDSLGGLERIMAQELHTGVYEVLCNEAALAPAGSNGVMFLPYLQGERCPHVNAHARGCFVGIGTHTTKADMIRSVLEGVAFSLRDVLERIANAGITPQNIRLSGGGAASPLWRQILADVLGCPVTTSVYGEDASAVGAGMLAGVAAGMWGSIEDATAKIQIRTETQPLAANTTRYETLFRTYQQLYPALAPSFEQLVSHD